MTQEEYNSRCEEIVDQIIESKLFYGVLLRGLLKDKISLDILTENIGERALKETNDELTWDEIGTEVVSQLLEINKEVGHKWT